MMDYLNSLINVSNKAFWFGYYGYQKQSKVFSSVLIRKTEVFTGIFEVSIIQSDLWKVILSGSLDRISDGSLRIIPILSENARILS